MKRRFKREKIDAIIDIVRTPMSAEQIASALFLDTISIRRYIKHMLESDALVITHKVRKRVFYKSTGQYNPPPQEDYYERDISVRRQIVTDTKPFRDPWTELFFGPVTPSR